MNIKKNNQLKDEGYICFSCYACSIANLTRITNESFALFFQIPLAKLNFIESEFWGVFSVNKS